MTIQPYLDRILETYSQGSRYHEVRKAKEEFFQRAGKVAEGSEMFEHQMQAFIDWYLFDRTLEGVDLCPVKMFVFEFDQKLPPEEAEIYREITKSVHSLYEFLKIKGNDVYLKDMVSGEKYVVEESEITKGFTKGDIFEGRLIRFQNRYVFGGSFIFHPQEVRSFIKKQIKAVRYLDAHQRLKLLHRLSVMKLKTEQYSHIDVKFIYTEKPLF